MGRTINLKALATQMSLKNREKNGAVATEAEKLTQSHLDINFLVYFFLTFVDRITESGSQ